MPSMVGPLSPLDVTDEAKLWAFESLSALAKKGAHLITASRFIFFHFGEACPGGGGVHSGSPHQTKCFFTTDIASDCSYLAILSHRGCVYGGDTAGYFPVGRATMWRGCGKLICGRKREIELMKQTLQSRDKNASLETARSPSLFARWSIGPCHS